jgi:hypothetical protein
MKLRLKKLKNTDKKYYVFIDYENVHNFNLDKIQMENVHVFILVGNYQTRLPYELVSQTQKFGSRLNWIKITGDGKNNLDFHLCYLLGQYNLMADKNVDFYVVSKDKGFDCVVKFINHNGRSCFRIENIE